MEEFMLQLCKVVHKLERCFPCTKICPHWRLVRMRNNMLLLTGPSHDPFIYAKINCPDKKKRLAIVDEGTFTEMNEETFTNELDDDTADSLRYIIRQY